MTPSLKTIQTLRRRGMLTATTLLDRTDPGSAPMRRWGDLLSLLHRADTEAAPAVSDIVPPRHWTSH